jgi:hypothetical protein
MRQTDEDLELCGQFPQTSLMSHSTVYAENCNSLAFPGLQYTIAWEARLMGLFVDSKTGVRLLAGLQSICRQSSTSRHDLGISNKIEG